MHRVPVGDDVREARGKLDVEVDPLARRPPPHPVGGGLDEGGDAHGRGGELRLTRFQRGEVEQLLHQRRHLVHFAVDEAEELGGGGGIVRGPRPAGSPPTL